MASARFLATRAVVPVAEKYATSVLMTGSFHFSDATSLFLPRLPYHLSDVVSIMRVCAVACEGMYTTP